MKKQKGFTIVEILVVIAIIGLLTAIAVPSIMSLSKKMKERGLDSKIESIEQSAVIFAQDNANKLKEKYPLSPKDEDGNYIFTLTIQDLVANGAYKSEKSQKNLNCNVINPYDESKCLDCVKVEIILDKDYKTASAQIKRDNNKYLTNVDTSCHDDNTFDFSGDEEWLSKVKSFEATIEGEIFQDQEESTVKIIETYNNGNQSDSMFYTATNDSTELGNGYKIEGFSTKELGDQTARVTKNGKSVTLEYTVLPGEYAYTINHYLMKMDGTYPVSPTSTTTGKAKYDIEFEAPRRQDLGGGFKLPELQNITISINESENVINYYYERNKYTITINPNGGNYSGETTIKGVYYESQRTINNPTKTGYTFTGWSISGTGTKLSGSTLTMGTGNVTLTANYRANKINVTLDANGGTFGDVISTPNIEDLRKVIVVEYGSTYGLSSMIATSSSDYITINSVPKRSGYVFDGWYTDSTNGEKIISSSRVNTPTNHTLYAHWKVNIKYQIHFIYQNTEGNWDSPENHTEIRETIEGSSVTITPTSAWGFLTPESKTVTIEKENTVIEIYYYRISYTIYLNANGGTNTDGSTIMTYKVYYGSSFNPPIPTKTTEEETAFVGWFDNTLKEGGNELKKVSYVNSSFSSYNNKTYYARWYIPFVVTNDNRYKVGYVVGMESFEIATWRKEYGDERKLFYSTSETDPNNDSSKSYKYYLTTEIGSKAFGNDRTSKGHKLKDIVIPDSVIKIQDRAFYNVDGGWKDILNINSVTLGDGIKYIGNEAFAYTNIPSINLPEGLEEIGDNAFTLTNLTKLNIPSTVKSIGERAFSTNEKLTTVIINDAPVNIGKEAFHDCTALKNVDLGNETISLGSGSLSNYTGTSLTIPASIISMEDALSGSMVEKVIIQEGSTKIYTGAFRNTHQLSEISIPNSVTRIEAGAFDSCKSLKSNGILLPNRLTYIGRWAFASCSNLSTMQIPNTVKYIGESAFRSCTDLISINIPYGITSIEDDTFWNTKIATIIIPDSVTRIGKRAFWEDRNLSSVTFGNGLEEIDENAFENCTQLKNITLPNSLKTIGDAAFMGCHIGSLVIPNSVITIGNSAFSGNYEYNAMIPYGLTKVTLGNSVQNIGSSAFSSNGITSIAIPNSVKNIGANAFHYNPLSTIYYKNNSYSKSAQFINDFRLNGSGYTIDDTVFSETATSR